MIEGRRYDRETEVQETKDEEIAEEIRKNGGRKERKRIKGKEINRDLILCVMVSGKSKEGGKKIEEITFRWIQGNLQGEREREREREEKNKRERERYYLKHKWNRIKLTQL